MDDYIFFILCGPNEKTIEDEIINKLKKKNYVALSDKKISRGYAIFVCL